MILGYITPVRVGFNVLLALLFTPSAFLTGLIRFLMGMVIDVIAWKTKINFPWSVYLLISLAQPRHGPAVRVRRDLRRPLRDGVRILPGGPGVLRGYLLRRIPRRDDAGEECRYHDRHEPRPRRLPYRACGMPLLPEALWKGSDRPRHGRGQSVRYADLRSSILFRDFPDNDNRPINSILSHFSPDCALLCENRANAGRSDRKYG